MFFVSEFYSKLSRSDPRHPIADKTVITDYESYLDIFSPASPAETLKGEASAAYLYYYKHAIPRIKQHLGDIKILIILRNPVDRAYSSYMHLVRDEVEQLTFEDFLDDEERRKSDNWDILNFPRSLGLYSEQVKAYMETFSQVKVILLDDLKNNPEKILSEVYQFLEVDYCENDLQQVKTGKVFNESSKPKSKFLTMLLSRQSPWIEAIKSTVKIFIPDQLVKKIKLGLQKKNKKKQEPMKDETRKKLEDFFREDIIKTQELINKDLSSWLR